MKKSKASTYTLAPASPGSIRFTLANFRAVPQERWWALLLAVTCIPVFWFLAHNHAFVPMWYEGIAEYEYTLLVMLGIIKDTPPFWIHYHHLHLPLALNAYIGPAFFYFHLPAAYLWFNGLTKDPYIYRYMGILFFFADGWLLYYLLRKYYKAAISSYGAMAFFTAPTLFLCLTDGGSYYFIVFFLLVIALCFTQYLQKGRTRFLLATALSLGVTTLTRIEMFVWLIIPFVSYLAVARPPLVLQRWRETKRKVIVGGLALSCFCLGAAPMIAYNFLTGSTFAFIKARVIPGLLGTLSLPPSAGVPSLPLTSKVVLRLGQFWTTVMLNRGPMWELKASNYVFAVIGLLCAGVLIYRWVARRAPSFLLIALLTTLPLSLLTSARLRYEHLTILHPVVLLIIVAGLAYLEKWPGTTKLVHVAFVLLILGNVTTSARDWRIWTQQPDTVQTMLNQSDPVLLTDYLSQHHASDQIFHTNMGTMQSVHYLSAGRLGGEDIMTWYDADVFANYVKTALTNKRQRRVFVAVGKERDGLPGTMARTKLLYSLLDQYHVPYTVTPLANARNRYLYELVVVEKGAGTREVFRESETLLVSEVTDVRVQSFGTDSLVIGSILGAGFKPGDVITVNDDLTVPTTFGHEKWITFAIPLGELTDSNSFTLEVLRPSSLERSRPFTVNFKR